ncbi:MAG TPA: hypothetical protein VMR86_06485 [Myxococcota bacterium]|nr:hypothetical protein [Myxococcota bacterium]
MAAKKVPDIRLVERSQRKAKGSALAADLESLPDLAANVAAAPSAEDLEKLKADLISEHDLRTRRIERFIKEGPLRPAPRAVIPVSENDL